MHDIDAMHATPLSPSEPAADHAPSIAQRGLQEFLDALERTDPEAAVAFYDLVAPLVRKHGRALGMPHFKYLPETFSEIRWKGRDGTRYRIYCAIELDRRVILLHGVTKKGWRKTTREDLRVCEERYRGHFFGGAT